jgi:hypothetical protein
MKLSERQVAQVCLDYLRCHGWTVHRLTADSYDGHRHKAHEQVEAGTPDYAVVYSCGPRPTTFYLETKKTGGKLRRSQEIWIADARRRGIPVCVADSYDALTQWMREMGI